MPIPEERDPRLEPIAPSAGGINVRNIPLVESGPRRRMTDEEYAQTYEQATQYVDPAHLDPAIEGEGRDILTDPETGQQYPQDPAQREAAAQNLRNVADRISDPELRSILYAQAESGDYEKLVRLTASTLSALEKQERLKREAAKRRDSIKAKIARTFLKPFEEIGDWQDDIRKIIANQAKNTKGLIWGEGISLDLPFTERDLTIPGARLGQLREGLVGRDWRSRPTLLEGGGTTTGGTGQFRFNPNVRLDTSQIDDRRPRDPTLAQLREDILGSITPPGVDLETYQQAGGDITRTLGQRDPISDLDAAGDDESALRRAIENASVNFPDVRGDIIEAAREGSIDYLKFIRTQLRDALVMQRRGQWEQLDDFNAQREAIRRQNKRSGLGKVAGPIFDIIENITEPLQRGYYAGQLIRTRGGGLGQQLQGLAAGTLGAEGFTRGRVRRAVEETNTREEREELRRGGWLASYGEVISGRFRDGKFRSELQRGTVGGQLPEPIRGQASAIIDFAFQNFADPTLFIGGPVLRQLRRPVDLVTEGGIRAARRAGADISAEEAGRLARYGFTQGRTGRAIVDAVVEAARTYRDPTALARALDRMPAVTAADITGAAATGSKDDVRRAVEQAITTGAYSPTVSAFRQMLGERAVRRAVEPGLGVTGRVRRAVRGTGVGISTVATRSATQAVRTALSSSAEVAKRFVGDIPTSPGSLVERWDDVLRFASDTDIAAFQDIVAQEIPEIRRLTGGFRPQPSIAAPRPNEWAEAEKRITQLEKLKNVLEGRLGQDAAAQARAELTQGYRQSLKTGRDIVARAAANASVVLGTAAELPWSKTLVRNLQEEISRLPKELADELSADLANAGKSAKALGQVRWALDELKDPDVLSEAFSLAKNKIKREAQSSIPFPAKAGLGKRTIQRIGRMYLDAEEAIAPRDIPFESAATASTRITRRVEAFDRWALALNLDDLARSRMRQVVTAARSEQDVYDAIEQTLRRLAEKNGVDAEKLLALERANRASVRASGALQRAFGVDEATGAAIRDQESVLAQRIHNIPLFDPDDIRRSIRILKRDGMSDDLAQALQKAKGGSDSDIINAMRAVLRAGHSAWKFNIVTNAYMPIIGLAGGFIGTEGNLGEKLQGAAVGGAIGLFGPVRYVMRVAGIEERGMRYYLERGAMRNLPEWVPGLSQWWRRAGLDRQFLNHDLVRAQRVAEIRIGQPFATAGQDWVVLGQRQPRFLHGWARILNNQIHPESDEITRLFLNAQAGVMSWDEAEKLARTYLKTENGKLLRERLKDGIGGTNNPKEIVRRYREFVEKHVPSPELANMRLRIAEEGGEITTDQLKRFVKQGEAPQQIHAQNTWTIPKNFREAKQTRNRIFADLVFQGPTNKFSRIPIAESIYRDEYLRLRRFGMEADLAQEIADDLAVRRTNRVMFKIEDESRLAKKLDVVFPFQQPREELVRVWGPLVKNNPVRALHMARMGALAFNNGQDRGIFTEDPYGNWRMSLPHARLGASIIGGVGFDARLQDFLFFSQGAFGQDLGLGLPVPSFGGPWWQIASNLWVKKFPDAYHNMPDIAKKFFFPYGAGGTLTTAPQRRLWMGLTGTAPPWEFASRKEQEDSLGGWENEMYKQMRYQHGIETGDWDWEPTPEQVREVTRNFFKFWSWLGATFPAAPQPTLSGKADFDRVMNLSKNQDGTVNWDLLKSRFPMANLYLTKDNRYVGPDDFKHWSKSEDERAEQFTTGHRKHLRLEEFIGDFKDAERRSRAFVEFNNILKDIDPYRREADLRLWRERNPDLAADFKNDYWRDKELLDILKYPKKVQDDMLNEWRKRYDVSPNELKKLKQKVRILGVPYDPWREARYPEQIAADVEDKVRRGFDEEEYVSSLKPAEQVLYWNDKQAQLQYYERQKDADPSDPLNTSSYIKSKISDLFKNYPELRERATRNVPDAWDAAIDKWQGDIREEISKAYEEINRLSAAMDAAAKAKNWNAFWPMKYKRDEIYDMIERLNDRTYKTIPELSRGVFGDFIRDILALFVPVHGVEGIIDTEYWRQQSGVQWVPSNEEASYLSKSPGVRKAYIADLIRDLNAPPGASGKKYWEYLTQFQKDLISRNMPEDQVNDWKALTAAEGAALSRAQRSGSSRGYSSSRRGSRTPPELQFAYDLMAKYNKRPAGAKPPAAYEEYLRLPARSKERSDFLNAHPEVKEWLNAGPMANMPEYERMIVTNIMIKYGKWEDRGGRNGYGGGSRGYPVELAFAREQLKLWNRRTGQRPEAYELWLNMPSGPEKQAFLRAHPEIQEWIRLGPMASMPEQYRNVVRDIMIRYGEWTENQDPLGQLVSQYYKTPSWARQKFLQEHPELKDYWAASRSPEEQLMYDLADQYFSFPEPSAKRAFLSAHPELQQFFLERRTARYENFLNQVAVYMGSNPELFEHYLQRQEDVLAELLKRFAQPTLLREVPSVRTQTTRRASRRAA